MSKPTLLDSLRVDAEAFRPGKASEQDRPAKSHPSSPKRPPRQSGHFLKGPVPLSWLQAAGRLPGKTLHVALQLRFWAGVQKQSTVRLNLSGLADWGLHRTAASRGLAHLEKAGLARVLKTPGGVAKVTIVEEPDAQSDPSGGTNTGTQSTDDE